MRVLRHPINHFKCLWWGPNYYNPRHGREPPLRIMKGDDVIPHDTFPVVHLLLLEQTLAEFGLTTTSFLFALWLLSSVVSGAAILAVMNNRRFPPGDLKIYTPHNRWFFMKHFLLCHPDIYLVQDGESAERKGYAAKNGLLPGVKSMWYFRNRKTKATIKVTVTKTV